MSFESADTSNLDIVGVQLFPYYNIKAQTQTSLISFLLKNYMTKSGRFLTKLR